MRLVARLVDEEVARDDPEDPDRDVDEEDPAPVEVFGDEPADEGADRKSERRGSGPDADRGPTLTRRKRGRDDRERRRVHEGGTCSLQDTSRDEHLPGAREPAEERGAGEDDNSDDEDQPTAIGVCDLAADEHQCGERQRIARDDPLELGEIRIEIALDRRQRNVHDGVVEHDHEQAERDRPQREPLPVLLCEDPSSHSCTLLPS